LNLDYVPPPSSFFRGTIKAFQFNSVLHWIDGEYYQLNIIDSPGLFEATTTEGEKERVNELLIKLAFDCVDRSVTNVTCFGIVQRQDTLMSEENVKTIEILLNTLSPEVRSNCCLILTHSESLNKAARKKKLDEIIEQKNIMELVDNKIFFMGSHTSELYGDFFDDDEKVSLVKKIAEQINEDQITLIEAIKKLIPVIPKECIDIIKEGRKDQLLNDSISNEPEEPYDIDTEIKFDISEISINVKKEVEDIRKFRIYPAKPLNVVLLGKSGSGKTTLTKTFLDVDHIPEGHGLFSRTTTPEPYFSVLEWNNQFYHLNIIDPPGIFESTRDPIEKRSNQVILDMTMSCIDNSVTKIHCFAIVLRQDVTLSQENIDVFEELGKVLPEEIRNNCCLILTHCEKFTKDKCEKKEKRLLKRLK